MVRRGVARNARRATPGESGCRGSVTAEFAVGLPAVVMVLVVVFLAATAAIGQVRCADAARAGAREAALGSAVAQVQATAEHLAGVGATVAVTREGPWVVVRVSRPVASFGWLGRGLVASGRAQAWVEPTAAGAPGLLAATGRAVAT